MIKKSISNLHSILARTGSGAIKFNNATSKTSAPELDITQIRNLNLKFDTSQWNVNLYPFYPQVYKKKDKSIYEVATNSIVLAMSFINKNVDDEVAWDNRKTISLKFKDVATMLTAELGSGREVTIQTQNATKNTNNNKGSQRHRVLKLKDVPSQQKVSIWLSSVIDNTRSAGISKMQARQQEWGFQTAMPYSQYRIMYKLIESSLLDLSGWRFMMEVQKRASLKKLEIRTSQDKQFNQLLQEH